MKHAPRTWLMLTAVLMILAILAGCASRSVAPTGQDGYYETTMATTTAGYQGDGAGSPDLAGDAQADRKIIRNASLDLEAGDVVKTYDDMLAWATARGGYETQRVQRKSDSYTTIDAQIKIKPEFLDAFIDYAATLGSIINTQISTEDITESYYDTKTRLQSMEKSLERYYDYLDKARNIEESLSVQNEINQLTLNIESLKGKLKLWDSLLAESVITLRLRQTNDPVKLKKEINWSTLSLADMGYLMRSGLTRVANFLVSLAQWLAIVAVVTAPLWITALIIILLVRKRNRKRRAARAAALDAARQEPGQARHPD